MATLEERIQVLVEVANEKVRQHFDQMGYKNLQPHTHQAEYLSSKWCRINRLEHGQTTSVYCFVALQDNTTKALGHVVAGDIHKAATYKAPAKHARGNVFDEDFAKHLTPYGAEYLR
jgi:hypothetical protein